MGRHIQVRRLGDRYVSVNPSSAAGYTETGVLEDLLLGPHMLPAARGSSQGDMRPHPLTLPAPAANLHVGAVGGLAAVCSCITVYCWFGVYALWLLEGLARGRRSGVASTLSTTVAAAVSHHDLCSFVPLLLRVSWRPRLQPAALFSAAVEP